MKIKYTFITGETIEIEVDADLGEAMSDIEHEQSLRNRAETRRHSSFDALVAAGFDVADQKNRPDTTYARQEEIKEHLDKLARLQEAVKLLLPQQQDLVHQIHFQKRTIASIALAEGVSEAAIRKRLKKIYAKLEKFLD